jgi:hypothetical protein
MPKLHDVLLKTGFFSGLAGGLILMTTLAGPIIPKEGATYPVRQYGIKREVPIIVTERDRRNAKDSKQFREYVSYPLLGLGVAAFLGGTLLYQRYARKNPGEVAREQQSSGRELRFGIDW